MIYVEKSVFCDVEKLHAKRLGISLHYKCLEIHDNIIGLMRLRLNKCDLYL